MEWCGKLYVSGSLEKYIRHFTELLAAVLLLCLLLSGVEGSESAVMRERTLEYERIDQDIYNTDVIDAGIAEAFGVICKTAALHTYADRTSSMCILLSGLAADAADEPESVLSETDSQRFQAYVKETEKATVRIPAPENGILENSAADILTAPEEIPEISGGLKDETDHITPVIPEAVPEVIPADPERIPEASPSAPHAGTVADGFLVDENGAICGIADPETAVKGSRLILPSEGCTSIASDAFLSAPEGIREVYIPANITDIEEGAFAGLSQLEWFSAESSGNYVSIDGVLFSDGGTCLLAFPAARIGIYSVPSEVVCFASDAFAGASIYKLDARGCVLENVGNIPEEIEILRRP